METFDELINRLNDAMLQRKQKQKEQVKEYLADKREWEPWMEDYLIERI